MTRISAGADAAGVQITGTPNKYRVRDVFTTHNGSWQLNDSVYGLPAWLERQPDQPGGAEHIYVRLSAATPSDVNPPWVKFATDIIIESQPLGRYRWANMPALNTYSPPAQSGWRHWLEGDGQIVVGGGLPDGEHVSLFVIWELNIEPDEPEEPTQPSPYTTYVTIPDEGHTVVIDAMGHFFYMQVQP